MKVLNCTSFINKFAFLYLSILIVTCHGPGSHDEILNDRFHEKVSMEQAKIRLEQLRAGNLMENEAHIRHHLENIAQIPENEMSEEQRSFHFFYIHDTDQNNKLDGLEILHSIMENHRDDIDANRNQKERDAEAEKARKEDPDHPLNWSWEELIEHIDSILIDYDRDNDGYINFYEFKRILDSHSAQHEASHSNSTEKRAAGSKNEKTSSSKEL